LLYRLSYALVTIDVAHDFVRKPEPNLDQVEDELFGIKRRRLIWCGNRRGSSVSGPVCRGACLPGQ
jgi:hypothetical protein